MNIKKLYGALLVAGLSLNAHAALLGFDDVTSGTELASYGGLTWTNVRVLDPSTDQTFAGTGFANGLISPKNVAFNFAGEPASIGSGTAFLLNSGYFTGASYNGLTIDFVGSTGGTTQFTKSVTVGLQGPLFVTFDWTIDLLQISTSCETGCEASDDGTVFGTHFVLDNLRINETSSNVPEPSGLALLCGGLLGMALMRKGQRTGH